MKEHIVVAITSTAVLLLFTAVFFILLPMQAETLGNLDGARAVILERAQMLAGSTAAWLALVLAAYTGFYWNVGRFFRHFDLCLTLMSMLYLGLSLATLFSLSA